MAAALARDGRRDEAESLLAALPEPASSARLDLLARIRAQEGDLDGAEACWKQVPPDDALASAAIAGLRRIAILRRRPSWLRFNLRFGAVLLAACAVVTLGAVGAVLAVAAGDNGGASVPVVTIGGGPGPTTSPSPAQSAAPTPSSTPSATSSGTQQAPNVELAATAATVTQQGGALVVAFKHGLFAPGGAALLPRAKLALLPIARGLASAGMPLAVLVIGHTDSVTPAGSGPYADNATLGFARAVVVADYLRKHSGLPLAAFTTASTGAGDPVSGNGNAAGRERNRTVVLQVRSR